VCVGEVPAVNFTAWTAAVKFDIFPGAEVGSIHVRQWVRVHARVQPSLTVRGVSAGSLQGGRCRKGHAASQPAGNSRYMNVILCRVAKMHRRL